MTNAGSYRAMRWIMGGYLFAALLALAACGGGGGDGGGGENTGTPSTAEYFPLNQGDRWLYVDGSGMKMRADVTGARSVPGGTAIVVRTIDDVDGTTETQYLKSATGVTIVPSPSDDPTTVALGSMQILRLPIVAGDRWTLADKTLAAVADFDGDGKLESVRVRIEASVVGFETVTLGGQTYSQVAHVRTSLTRWVVLTSNNQTFTDTSTSDDWYAPDVGPIRNLTTIVAGGQSQATDSHLAGWRVGTRRSETVAPTLTAQVPTADATVYGGFQSLQMTFSEPMDTMVPAGQVWVLTGPDGKAVLGDAQWTRDGTGMVFSYPGALASGRYTARVTTLAADMLGNQLAAELLWTFDVDASGPAPIPVSPLPGATEVPLGSAVVFTLDEEPNPATVNVNTVRLLDIATAVFVDASVTLTGRTVTMQPTSPLSNAGRYQVIVLGITDLHGNPTQWSGWSFTADPGRFAAPQRLIENGSITAVAIGDVDGDGRPDALMVSGYDNGSADGFTLFVRRSTGGGNFAAAQRYPTIAQYTAVIDSMVVADLDRNGRMAVVLGAPDKGIQIMRQQADGTLASSQVIETRASAAVRVTDMDGDGRLDLVSTGSYGSSVSVWLQGTDGRFGAAMEVPVPMGGFSDLAVGDIDGDGQPDIAVINGSVAAQPVVVVLRTAGGGYAAPVRPSLDSLDDHQVRSLAIGDVTGDGRADLVLVQTNSGRLVVLAQRPDGSFDAPSLVNGIPNGRHLRLADMDGDGRTDVVSWSWGGFVVALNRQRGDGTLGAVETWSVTDYGFPTHDLVAIGDLDGDGRPDLLHASAWLRQRVVASTASAAGVAKQLKQSGAPRSAVRGGLSRAVTMPRS